MALNWDSIKKGFLSSPNGIEILEKTYKDHYESTLDTIVNSASIITVNGVLRLLCSGETKYENMLLFNNTFRSYIGENRYAVAHDVFGGLYALTENGISYFSPDALVWEDLMISYEGFIEWISTKSISDFYQSFMWSGFEDYVKSIKPGEGIHLYPFLWAKECDVHTASKRIVRFDELLAVNNDFRMDFERLAKYEQGE